MKSTGTCDLRLAGICKECRKRLGIEERLTCPLLSVDVNNLPEFDPKKMAGVQFVGHLLAFGADNERHRTGGTTKITYKIAKTVKEVIDDAASHTSHPGSHHEGSSPKAGSRR